MNVQFNFSEMYIQHCKQSQNVNITLFDTDSE